VLRTLLKLRSQPVFNPSWILWRDYQRFTNGNPTGLPNCFNENWSSDPVGPYEIACEGDLPGAPFLVLHLKDNNAAKILRGPLISKAALKPWTKVPKIFTSENSNSNTAWPLSMFSNFIFFTSSQHCQFPLHKKLPSQSSSAEGGKLKHPSSFLYENLTASSTRPMTK